MSPTITKLADFAANLEPHEQRLADAKLQWIATGRRTNALQGPHPRGIDWQ